MEKENDKRFTVDFGESARCNFCKHYLGFAKCKAYPNGITNEIINDVHYNKNNQCSEKYHFEEK